ncbi:cytochrome c biogenesis ATP-binding export protein CcmA [Thiosulfatimonas sediminis]|uniref:Cytochrome c biogenesis ATP-binding export protein CcmA n=1 Tax=Thiosulfatimonas sediminis TaxID=2675054 RepID=A0A6F8PXG0_9GAMM|nr:cytochrome c biogenesis heme-transporting ATPase CcmA [Thiosulfatimonas sediminis]BBP46678.1 cytochrome c biogenesis ATP-binding export protein CcmA [Thiosulfatimonas sediminis]
MHLEAQNLCCQRGAQILFSDINFRLEGGKVLLVEGKNGAGKTTLLKLLSGLRRPDKGEIKWDGVAINAADSQFNQQLAWLGHQNPLKEEQTALENLAMLGAIRTRNQRDEFDALSAVGLGRVKHKPVKTFSAGMKRRLALASLLIADTRLWILDEPQAALDKAGIALYEQLATEHLKNGGMIVMTSHHEVAIDDIYIQRLNLGH